jgi:hypothetical protein
MNFRVYNKSVKTILPINSLKEICINSERLTEEEWSDLVFMRGSGMFDKKGVEIFEGDFCKNDLDEYGIIMYSEGSFWLSFFDEPAKQHLSDFKKYNKDNTSLLIDGIRSFINCN